MVRFLHQHFRKIVACELAAIAVVSFCLFGKITGVSASSEALGRVGSDSGESRNISDSERDRDTGE